MKKSWFMTAKEHYLYYIFLRLLQNVLGICFPLLYVHNFSRSALLICALLYLASPLHFHVHSYSTVHQCNLSDRRIRQQCPHCLCAGRSLCWAARVWRSTGTTTGTQCSRSRCPDATCSSASPPGTCTVHLLAHTNRISCVSAQCSMLDLTTRA